MFPDPLSLVVPENIGDTGKVARLWSRKIGELPGRDTVLNNPFLISVSDVERESDTGAVPDREELLAVWAANMLPLSYSFPSYVTALASRAPSDIVRHKLIANAWDESGGEKHTARSHFWLAIRFARMLGMSNSEIETLRPLPTTVEYINAHHSMCATGDFAHALGLICMIEEWAVPMYSTILKAFVRVSVSGGGSKIDSFVRKGGAAYFNGNISDDARHCKEMRELLGAWLVANGVSIDDEVAIEEKLSPVIEGARHNTELRAKMYQGLYDYVKDGGTLNELLGR